MSFKLNEDVLYLIFKELQDDEKSLYSCLLVNKTWCETAVPILWRNPWKCLEGWRGQKKEEALLNVIISYLSDESKNKLRMTNSYRKPLFDYISFCKHLNLKMIRVIEYECFDIKMVKDEIVDLFINRNIKFTHLYLTDYSYYNKIYLSNPGAISEI